MSIADHPHTDPHDGRQQCDMCFKFVWPGTHSCKGVPVGDQYDPAAKRFHPYPDDPEPSEFTDDEWLMLMRDLSPHTPIGISRHYVAVKRRHAEMVDPQESGHAADLEDADRNDESREA